MTSHTRASAVLLALLGLWFGPPAHAAKAPTPAADTGAADQVTETLFSDMKAGKFEAAFGMFDSRMQAAVSQVKLQSVWSDQIKEFGPLVSRTITQRLQSQGLEVRIALLKFDHGTLQATVAVHPDTQEVAGFVIKPAPSSAKPAPPAPYVHPADFRATEVKIGAAPYVLGGTLCEPVGLGPFPAAILIHGSGPQDRDETIGANKVFKDIAEGLASSGVAVFRYDKRTFIYGAQIGDSISVEDEVMVDAASALAALRARPEIDPKRIFVIGHSMGALLAPEIAVRDGSVAGVACLAPPGRPVGDIVIDQMKYSGASPKDVAEMEQKVARMKAGTLGTERFFGAPQSYWRDLDARDGIGMAKKLGKPVLVMRGDRDFQVGAADLAAWKAGLAGTPSTTVETVPGLSHLFIAGEGKPSPEEYDRPGHVDGRVIQKLTIFIKPAKS